MNIIEDQLYEDLLKSGEVVLLTKSSNYEVSSATTRRLFAVTLGWKVDIYPYNKYVQYIITKYIQCLCVNIITGAWAYRSQHVSCLKAIVWISL